MLVLVGACALILLALFSIIPLCLALLAMALARSITGRR